MGVAMVLRWPVVSSMTGLIALNPLIMTPTMYMAGEQDSGTARGSRTAFRPRYIQCLVRGAKTRRLSDTDQDGAALYVVFLQR